MAINSVALIENRMIAVLYCGTHERVGTFGDLIYNDPLAYANLVLNGDSKAHLEVVTEYQPLDQAQLLS